jgi:hypothetical protein
MAPNPPFRSVTEELLFEILQKLPDMTYLTSQDIDSLGKLNALILDADLAPAGEAQTAIESIKGNVPSTADTLEKLYGIIQGLTFLKAEDIDTLAELNAVLTDADLLRGGDIQFPNVLFVSPTGDNSHGLKGDISRPFAADGIPLSAMPGDKVKFLPGEYNVAVNIAVNGVEYGTLGGGVKITASQPGSVLFDYSAIADSNLPVRIDGEFDFDLDANAGGVFNFTKPGQTPRQYVIRWRTVSQAKGIFLRMPLLLTAGTFEGHIEMMSSADQPGIVCDGNGCTGNGRMNLIINNNSLTAGAIAPHFNGFSFKVDYSSNVMGLFTPPINNTFDPNIYSLKINQGASAITYITTGNYDISLTGGTLAIMGGARVALKGLLKNCTLHAGPATDTDAQCVADSVAILNDQVTLLILDGIWRSCTYNRTSTNPVVLKGNFFNFTFLGSPGMMTITGRVELTAGNYISGEGFHYVDVLGTLIGDAASLFIFGLDYKVLISGRLKNLNPDGQLFTTAHIGNVYTLILDGAIMEAGSSALEAMTVFIEDTVSLLMYGRSYINKPIGGPGTINYSVGDAADLIVNAQVLVLP